VSVHSLTTMASKIGIGYRPNWLPTLLKASDDGLKKLGKGGVRQVSGELASDPQTPPEEKGRG
jgi:hypothetical protein